MFVNSETGSYLLGAIHGDGHISKRSVEIAVSGKAAWYADMLIELWQGINYDPHWYRDKRDVIRVAVHSSALAAEMRAFKGVDRWSFPQTPSFPSAYLAGLVDTDGFVSAPRTGHRVNIVQKAADKLPNIRPILDRLGFQHISILRKNSNKVRGKVYPVDEVWWNTQDDVLQFASIVTLKHKAKAERLDCCVEYIKELRNNNKSYHVAKFLRENDGATIPDICGALNFDRADVLHALNRMRRQSRVTRNDPPIDSLVWKWVDTNRSKGE